MDGHPTAFNIIEMINSFTFGTVCLCIQIWRRAYDVPPPALEEKDPRYAGNDPRYKVYSDTRWFDSTLDGLSGSSYPMNS